MVRAVPRKSRFLLPHEDLELNDVNNQPLAGERSAARYENILLLWPGNHRPETTNVRRGANQDPILDEDPPLTLRGRLLA